MPYDRINTAISSEPQLCFGARPLSPPVPPAKLMYATTPGGFAAALAIDVRPPIDDPASTMRSVSAQGWRRSQSSVAVIAVAAADAARSK